MMKQLRLMLAALCAVIFAGCASVDPSHYAKEQPALDLKQYFNGTVDAWGMFQDRSGKVIKRFTVVMRCEWKGDVGVLDEDFTFSDGTKQKRIWTLRQTAPGKFVGTAEDVVGEAVGIVSGNALKWDYVLALPVDGRIIHVNFEDWMFQMDDQVMLNRAVMSKFGIKLGEVTLAFKRRQAP